MLTSKPPFQSNTTDEIYRRAKERDYEWPEAGQSQKVINWEAKDLVATMLQEAEKRPEPDAIVQHEFFSSGFVPLPSDMTVRLRELPPDKAEFLMPQRQLQGNSQNKQNLMELCRMCEVGPWSRPQRLHSTIWREMAHEEKAGLTPIIPLAHGVVYRPFDEIQKEQQAAVLDLTAQLQSGLTLVDSSAASQRTVPALLRQPPQSFAAQLRAQNKPRSNVAPMEARSRPENAATTTESERPRPIREMLSSQATQEVAPRKASNSKRTPLPTLKPRVPSGELEAAKKEALPAPVQTKATSERSGPVTASLFSPLELQENVPGTHPDAVLDRLRKLQTELERALNARTMAIISAKDARREAPPRIVVKWVDYTNKFGLGYILNDGSVGCILKTIPSKEGTKDVILPPAYFLVRDAERHIQRRQDETYPDRHQLLPMTESVYFYENNGERGISRVRVDPESFRVPVGDDGTAAKLSVGKDIYDHRKRERLVLWKKFANYMMANGRDQGALPEDFPMDAQSNGGSGSQTSPDDVVTFYQRFGDVGCWVFCDGHIQVSSSAPPVSHVCAETDY